MPASGRVRRVLSRLHVPVVGLGLLGGLLLASSAGAQCLGSHPSADPDGTGCIYRFQDPDPSDDVRHPNIDPDASVVYVRRDCGDRPNCFESMRMLSDFSDGWLWVGAERGGRSDPQRKVLVDIGPGTFGSFSCPDRRMNPAHLERVLPLCQGEPLCEAQLAAQTTAPRAGHVSLRGAGRDATILTNVSGLVSNPNPFGGEGEDEGGEDSGDGLSGFRGQGCVDIAVSHLTLRGKTYAAVWNGGGSSVWVDVDLESFPDPLSLPAPDNRVSTAIATGWAGVCPIRPAIESWLPGPENGDAPAPTGDRRIPLLGGSTADGRPIHFYHGVRVRGFGTGGGLGEVPATAFYDSCAENWFYGGEVSLHISRPELAANRNGAVAVLLPESEDTAGGDFRAFGTKISAIADVPLEGPLVGVGVVEAPDRADRTAEPRSRAQFHLHGGLISVLNRSSAANDIVGIRVEGVDGHSASPHFALAHTVESGFELEQRGTGTSTRLEAADGGVLLAPFLWPPSDTAPSERLASFSSLAGQDLYVETDCDGSGDCQSGRGNQSHLFVFDETCDGRGPWRSSVSGDCR